ncbi:type I restriction-modification system, specificity subunit S [Buttiauxella brennerae ATCC 51605]|uniref:Type I restriction-modification system, specificity subunit S n=1 Tax=Buttiauxella brennerae ATCC 51605 TaxID=1354251 RepID=A0A1B7IEU9_9ENTR|nr:restriction endonuclease subunit S [Buttiauxella brennerae]OAT27800.1 type I restriction-modification system, specificity subunit S [Buttiauxella brennerae ATCC 51605]
MGSKWKKKTLDALGRIVTGRTPPSTIVGAFGGSIPFVTPSDMDGTRIISTTARTLSATGQSAVKNAFIPNNAVMVSCIGSNMGKAAIAGANCITNQQINSIVIDTDDSPLFIYYNLSLRKSEIRGIASGSAQPILNKSAFGRLEIELPPPEEQRAIAHILSTLDDKIELNRRQNETLEAMAHALFKAWFVDFEPVRAKQERRWQHGLSLPGLPAHLYDLFPDRLVDSALGEIPEGWESVPASRLVEFNPSLPLRKGTKAPYIEMAALPTSGSWPEPPVLRPFGSGMRFRNGDTLLARITPCLENGKTAFVQCLPDNTVGWGSTEYIVMRPKAPVPPEFGYLLARDAAFREQAIRSMTGTSGRQRVQADSVAGFKLTVPKHEAVWGAFSHVVTPVFMSIKKNAEAIATLAQLRDTLLPKLISGELHIPDAECKVGV